MILMTAMLYRRMIIQMMKYYTSSNHIHFPFQPVLVQFHST